MGSFWPDPFGEATNGVDRQYYLRQGENVDEKIHKNLFVKVQVDKPTCYVGEPIVASYKLYSRLRFESRVTKFPYLNGFSVYDMINPGTDASGVETLNGKSFDVRTIREAQLIPLQAGKIELDPLEMDNTVEFIKGNGAKSHRRSGDPFEDFFDQTPGEASGPQIEEHVSLATKPLDITVMPLPVQHKPANFNGAVGQFSITAGLTNGNIMTQDEAHLKITVQGHGNLPVINAPQVQWPAGLHPFDPTAKADIDKTIVPLGGIKTFDYMFTPDNAGHYVLPPIIFSYFDPLTRVYKTIKTDTLVFQVSPAIKNKHPNADYASITGSSTRKTGAWLSLSLFIQGHLEAIFAVLILSVLAFYLWKQNLRLKRSEKQKEEALKLALSTHVGRTVVLHPADPLLEARQRLEQGDYQGFYRDLNRSVWKAVAAQVNLPASELNKYNVLRQLEAKGWDAVTLLSLEHLLNECEMNLYTPNEDSYNMQQLLGQAGSLFGVLVANTSY